MPDDRRGPYLSDGYPGQVLITDPGGSNRTVWTDADNIGSNRETLSEDRTYYVSTTGSDDHDGLTAETAFLTIQHAVDVVGLLYAGAFRVEIEVADGTYQESVTLPNYPASRETAYDDATASFVLTGNLTNPAACIISYGMKGAAAIVSWGNWRVAGFAINIRPAFYAVQVSGGRLSLGTMHFHSVGAESIGLAAYGGKIFGNGVWTFFGADWAWFILATRGTLQAIGSMVVTDSATVTYAFLEAMVHSDVFIYGEMSGAVVTGVAYIGSGMSLISNSGGTEIPGTLPGTLLTGALYTTDPKTRNMPYIPERRPPAKKAKKDT